MTMSANHPAGAGAHPSPARDRPATATQRRWELHQLTAPIITAPTARQSLTALCEALARILCVPDIAVTINDGHPEPVLLVATSRTASRAVAAQRELQQGPHLAATTMGSSTVASTLAADQRWPEAAAVLANLGLDTALALPLAFNGRRLGAVSLYARTHQRFDDEQLQAAQLLVDVAAANHAYRRRSVMSTVPMLHQ